MRHPFGVQKPRQEVKVGLGGREWGVIALVHNHGDTIGDPVLGLLGPSVPDLGQMISAISPGG